MQLALECPVALMDRYQSLADFDFILTHLTDNDTYRDYYRYSNRFKILDNSTHELRYPCSVDTILAAAEIYKPDYVCPPDYLGDAKKTLADLEEMEGKLPEGVSILPILQSDKDSYESIKAFVRHLKSRNYHCVAVPSVILIDRSNPLSRLAQTRYEVVSYLAADFDWIHLLGMGDPNELPHYRKMDNVRSIDTGSPITNGIVGIRYGRDEPLSKKAGMLPFDFDELTPLVERNILYNLAYVRMLISKDDEWLPSKGHV